MLNGRRVLFPMFRNGREPVGGTNVIIDHINELRRIGVAAHPVYPHPKRLYPFRKTDADPLVLPNLMKAIIPSTLPLKRKRKILKSHTAMLFGGQRSLNLRPTDIIAGEENLHAIRDLFPGNLKVLCIQDVYHLMIKGRLDKADFPFAFATSEAAKAALETMYDGEVALVPLVVGSGGVGEFSCRKKRQIALFPRKRPTDADILTRMIQEDLPDWRVARIENVTDDERDIILRESAIFLSLSYKEGFGLPSAEAMCAGCLVVGYAGVGGTEFMTRETCVLVPDDDIVTFIAELRKAAGSFREDSTFAGKYDKIRRNGFDTVKAKYSNENFRQAFHAFWNNVDRTPR